MLGSIEVVGPASRQALAPVARTLLALLLVHRRHVVAADSLTDALWDDDPPSTARATLQTHLSKLRRVLATSPGITLEHRPPGYVLAADRRFVDADRFEDGRTEARTAARIDPRRSVAILDGALSCWRGPALCEFADAEWARAEAMRLDELRLVAREERADALLAAGEHAVAVSDLEALVSDAPLRERPRGQLMRALHATGRQAEALRSAHELRTVLADELGLEPSTTFRELELAIARDDVPPVRSAGGPARRVSSDGRGRATSGRTTTVPMAATDLVGREQELESLRVLVRDAALVTLKGPGGVGKSRLALEVARSSATFPDGVRVIELAPVADDGAVLESVAIALGVDRRPERSLEQSILEVLAPLDLLLVIDNCEHVLTAVGRLVGEILRWCPTVRVLTTSREALGMPGERVWELSPLPVPPDLAATVEAMTLSPSVQVFVARARDAARRFELTEENAGAVGAICVRLDGIPLALELAAARMGAMAPAQLRDRLDERFALLRGGSAVDERHRTLTELVRWSYELLSPPEQLLLVRLSVFAGGFDLEGAERTCGTGGLDIGDVAALVLSLVDKSLVIADTEDDQVRYRQLETIRQYGSHLLDRSDEGPAIRAAHLETYCDLGRRAEAGLEGPDEARWSAALERDADNLRAAVRTAVADDDADRGLALVVGVREHAFRRMRYELVRWAEEVGGLPSALDHPLRPAALAVVAYGSFVHGDLDPAIERAEGALAEGRRLGVPSTGLAERVLANALVYRGESGVGLRWMDTMAAVAESGGVPARIAHARYMQSVARTSLGDPESGRASRSWRWRPHG